jgi:hypothetical protein
MREEGGWEVGDRKGRWEVGRKGGGWEAGGLGMHSLGISSSVEQSCSFSIVGIQAYPV